MPRLIKEVALITGSSKGIGREIALLFAKEGAKVIINGTNQEQVERTVKEMNGMGYNVYGSVFDTTDRNAISKEINTIESELGYITVLVNNAGISPKKDGQKVRVQDMDYAEWLRVMDVNINGVFNCCQAVIPRMVEAKKGKIINISSAFARRYSAITASHYVTSKTAIIGFTQALCGELAEHGINCNSIAPGRTWTEMTRLVSDEANETFMKDIPMKRFAEALDIAKAALYLASEDAAYVNGSTLDINGGYAMV